MKKNLYIVILVGGSGTRFWPLSRQNKPKQFLDIVGRKSLFKQTLFRIKPATKASNVFIVTNRRYGKTVERQVSGFGIPKRNIMLEPQAKNTAPAICWAALRIHEKNPDATMIVLPSDHLILKPKIFLQNIANAVQLAQKKYLVTLGVVPTRPETGYGYLKIKNVRKPGGMVTFVEKFTEKPSLQKAREFIREKRYLWNSGMFIWRCDTILGEMQRHLPKIYSSLKQMGLAPKRRYWDKIPSVSVDHGILEKANNVVAVSSSNMGWSDLGSWESLTDVLRKDYKGNTYSGNIIDVNCEDTFILSDKRLVAAVGLKDVVIIDTKDALLVCRKDMSQNVKDVVGNLHKKELKKYL